MSSGNRTALAKAESIANEFVGLIEGAADEVIVAGSIRRKKPMVGDVEIVAVVSNFANFRARMDVLLMEGHVKQALYGLKRQTRWKERYFGCRFGGMLVEVFVADKNNRGFQLWLRTGPGDANMQMMGILKQGFSPLRFKDGYGWLVNYTEPRSPDNYERVGKLHLPDEAAVFKAMNMILPPANPRWRVDGMYHDELMRPNPQWDILKEMVSESSAVQRSMF